MLLRVLCTHASLSWTLGPPELWAAAPHSPPSPAKAFLIPSSKQCGRPEESDSFYLWVSILCNFPIQLSEEQPSELAPAKVICPCLLVEFFFFPASKGRKEIAWPKLHGHSLWKGFCPRLSWICKDYEGCYVPGSPDKSISTHSCLVVSQLGLCLLRWTHGNQAWISSPNFLLLALGLSWKLICKVQCDLHLLLF